MEIKYWKNSQFILIDAKKTIYKDSNVESLLDDKDSIINHDSNLTSIINDISNLVNEINNNKTSTSASETTETISEINNKTIDFRKIDLLNLSKNDETAIVQRINELSANEQSIMFDVALMNIQSTHPLTFKEYLATGDSSLLLKPDEVENKLSNNLYSEFMEYKSGIQLTRSFEGTILDNIFTKMTNHAIFFFTM